MATKMTREEALNKVRQMSLPKETMGILEALAPELAESEDERIRKELVEAFEALDIDSSWNGIPVKSILAWLEKQKEQKPADLSEMMVHKEPYIAPVPTPMVADEQKPVKPSGKLSRQDYLYQLLIDQLITYSDYEYLIEHKPAELKEDTQFLAGDYAISHYEQGKTYSASKVPVSHDLEEAALEYIQGALCDLDDGPTVGLAKEAFIAGAEWQRIRDAARRK